MQGFIALPLVFLSLLVVAGAALVLVRRKRGRMSGRHLNDLSPVSSQWLADRRRSG